MISVGVIDSGQLSLLGLRYLLEREADMIVEFAATSPVPLGPRPLDCLVLDLELADELSIMLRDRGETLVPKVIGLAADEALGRPQFDVTEVCFREDAPNHLVTAVRRLAAQGGKVSTGAVARTGVSCLSPREQEVLRHIAEGFTHDQVARRIGISRHTVDTYVKRIRSKLGVGNKAQLVRAAMAGLLRRFNQ
jgi:two-component system, NarL family, invasion response regulator UvrY